jgi:hypothetical protein
VALHWRIERVSINLPDADEARAVTGYERGAIAVRVDARLRSCRRIDRQARRVAIRGAPGVNLCQRSRGGLRADVIV